MLLPFLTEEILKTKTATPLLKLILIFLPSTILTFNAGFIYWSVSAMETSLYLLLFAATIITKVKNNSAFPLFAVLVTFVRPEGVLLFFVIEIHDLIFNYSALKKSNFKKIIFETVLYYVLISTYFLFRFFYYGNFLPNTFYAKAGLDFYHIERGVK